VNAAVANSPSDADQALDTLFLQGTRGLFGAVWNGYLFHHLLYYRQSDLCSPEELIAIGREAGLGRQGRAFAHRSRRPPPDGWALVSAADACPEIRQALGMLGRSARLSRGGACLYAARGWLQLRMVEGSVAMSPKASQDFARASSLEPELAWAHLGQGIAAESFRDYAGAIRHLSRAVELRPDWAWAYALRGVMYWYFAQLQESIRDLQKAVALEPRFAFAYMLLGRARADTRDPDMVRDLDRAIRLCPGSGVFYAWRGRAHYLLQDDARAGRDLSRAIARSPLFDRAHSWRGAVCVRRGLYHKGLRDLDEAARLNPFFASTHYLRARALHRLGHPAQALRAIRQASRLDTRYLWDRCFNDVLRPSPAYERAVEDLRLLIEHYPRRAWLWAWLGQTYLLQKRYRAALEALDRAEALGRQDQWTLLWRGEAYRRLGLCRRAGRDFEAAVSIAPRCAWALAGKGYCALYLGDYTGSLESLDYAIELNPRCGRGLAHLWRAEARWRLGLLDQAASDLRIALDFYPNWHWAQAWLCQLVGGARAPSGRWLATHRLGEPPDVAPSTLSGLDEHLRRAPHDRAAYLQRASLRIRLGDPVGAIEDASRALEPDLDPTDATGYLLRAQAKRLAGYPEAALEDLRRLQALAGRLRRSPGAEHRSSLSAEVSRLLETSACVGANSWR